MSYLQLRHDAELKTYTSDCQFSFPFNLKAKTQVTNCTKDYLLCVL